MGLNDIAWQTLFDRYDILGNIEKSGQFIISSNQIKEFREPRLMTKFDHKINLPTIFADNGLIMSFRRFLHTKNLNRQSLMCREFQFLLISRV